MRTAAATALASFAVAAPAHAATAQVKADCDRYRCSWTVTYTAAPGERNDVTVNRAEGWVDIADAGATITGCTSLEPSRVRCTTAPGEHVGVDVGLGDGDDRARGAARMRGGPGRDHLIGDPAGPTVFVDAAGGEPDVYEGGAGPNDTVDFSERADGIRVDLRQGAAAGDVLTSVEHVVGTQGDDVLIGTEGPNELSGHRGADRLVGLGGDDELYSDIEYGDERAQPGREVLDGGAGNDELVVNARSRGGAVSRCGAGRDDLMGTWPADFVAGDCEVLGVGDGGSSHWPVRLHVDRPVFYRDTLPAQLTARAGDRVVARGREQLRLNAVGRRLLERRGRLRVSITLVDRGRTYGFRTELQRPR